MASVDLDPKSTITLGDSNAPHELVLVTNLSCPFCHKWWTNNKESVLKAIDDKKFQFHMKFLTKDHLPLLVGNVANQYVDFDNPKQALQFVSDLEDNFEEFKAHGPKSVGSYLEDKYGVKQQNSPEEVEKVSNALKDAGVKTIPTIILDGEWHADSSWDLPELD